MEEFKQRQRAIWDAGDVVTLSQYVSDVGERVVARAGVAPAMPVLDVACGTATRPSRRRTALASRGSTSFPSCSTRAAGRPKRRGSRSSGSYMPPPPDFASPVLWGSEDHVREMFADVATGFAFEHHTTTIEWDSVEGFADYFMDRFGPMVTARQMLGDRSASYASKRSPSGGRSTRPTTAAWCCPRSTCCPSSLSEAPTPARRPASASGTRLRGA